MGWSRCSARAMRRMEPVNLSNKKEISFWAKGDGKTYVLVMLTAARSGQDGMPAMTQFFAGPEWKHYSVSALDV